MKCKLASSAAREFHEIVLWYNEQNPVAAANFIMEFEKAKEQICAYPNASFLLREPDLRRIILKRYHHAIIFKIFSAEILILCVTDMRRDPKHWQDATISK
jgi:Plasmid stabilization system protein